MPHATLPPHRTPQEQVRLEAMFREVFEKHFPFNQVIGIRIDSFDVQSPRLVFDMRPELVGSPVHKRLHGGVIATALDTVGGFAVALAAAEKFPHETADELMHRFSRFGTIDLRVDYLNQGVGKRFHATATVMRLGGRIASARMELHNDAGVLVATGAGAFVVS